MSEKFQLAIASIKSGNTPLGQQLLAQVILEEPNNESAWLWMSELVSEDKKQYCFERILKINPNNQQAIQAVGNLKQLEIEAEAGLMTVAAPSKPTPMVVPQPIYSPPAENIHQPQSVELMPTSEKNVTKPTTPKLWLTHTTKTIHALILFEDKLMTGKIEPQFGNHAVNIVLQGNLPLDLITEKVSIAYSRLIKVKGTGNSLKFYFKDQNGRNETKVVECKDKERLGTILDTLERRLGSDFERASTPINRRQTITGGGILMLIVLAISAFLYFTTLDIKSGGTTALSSARTRGIISLLGSIGPNGIGCIGGGMLVVLFIFMIYMLVKPPINTAITRKDFTSQ